MQSITGNNYGAGLTSRVGTSLRIAPVAELACGAAVSLGLFLLAEQLAFVFVTDPAVVAEPTGNLLLVFLTFVLIGHLMIVSAHFQAIGKARMSVVFGLSKPYLSFVPMIYLLPLVLGEMGLWLAWAVGHALLLTLTVLVLFWRMRQTSAPANPVNAGTGGVS